MGAGPELSRSSPLEMKQGAHWTQALRYKQEDSNGTRTPVDITNFDARCKIKKKYSDSTAVFELTKTNGKIVFNDPTNGELTLKLTDTETGTVEINLSGGGLDVPSTLLVFDIELVDTDGDVFDAGTVIPFLRGPIKVYAEVTD